MEIEKITDSGFDIFEHYVIWVPIFAVASAILVIWLLHKAKDNKRTKKYLNDRIVEWVTIIVIAYTLCVWVIRIIGSTVLRVTQ